MEKKKKKREGRERRKMVTMIEPPRIFL